jgi:tRNA-dihydrouridine synthase C
MEGVTEPVFRELVLERNPPSDLGGAFTEFVRVSVHALPRHVLERHLGERRFPQPVGLQIMGSDPELVAETARRAVHAGAPLIDLNFGCPSKGALAGCAGSALLDDPPALERMVAAVVRAVPERPVSAKIRAGGTDDVRLEELARAVEAGGAALLSVHCRTRAEGYSDSADWRRIARAVAAVSIPVCGNGGVASHGDLARLREETGARYAMVGRAALGDPWIFSGRRVTSAEAAGFLLAYARSLAAAGSSLAGQARRLKQLLAYWVAGELVSDEADRRAWLREVEPARLLERLAAAGEEARPAGGPGGAAGWEVRPPRSP